MRSSVNGMVGTSIDVVSSSRRNAAGMDGDVYHTSRSGDLPPALQPHHSYYLYMQLYSSNDSKQKIKRNNHRHIVLFSSLTEKRDSLSES